MCGFALAALQEEADELRAEVQRLNQLLKEVNAKEFAMDSATKQNTDLLKLLMKTEAEVEEVPSFCWARLCADSMACALACVPIRS